MSVIQRKSAQFPAEHPRRRGKVLPQTRSRRPARKSKPNTVALEQESGITKRNAAPTAPLPQPKAVPEITPPLRQLPSAQAYWGWGSCLLLTSVSIHLIGKWSVCPKTFVPRGGACRKRETWAWWFCVKISIKRPRMSCKGGWWYTFGQNSNAQRSWAVNGEGYGQQWQCAVHAAQLRPFPGLRNA